MTLGYLVRRLLAVILVLIVVTFAVFAITMILPGNAAVMILGEYGADEAVAALERRLGLDKSWYIQYFSWVKGILSGDFGQSLRLSLPVADVVGDAFLKVKRPFIPVRKLTSVSRGCSAERPRRFPRHTPHARVHRVPARICNFHLAWLQHLL